MWQWQFIAVILPLLAVLFFTVLAAFYIKASYNDQYELKDPAVSTRTLVDLDPTHRRIIQDMVSFLEKRVAQQICNQEETKPFTSEVLLHHMKMTESELETIKKCVHDYPYLGIHVENDVWSIPPGRLPLWCTVKTFLWNMLLSSIFVIVCKFVLFFYGIDLVKLTNLFVFLCSVWCSDCYSFFGDGG